MKKTFLVLLIGSFILLGSQTLYASPHEINFDDQPQIGTTGVVITDQYAGVIFSSTAGYVNYVSTQESYKSTKPNFLCTGPIGGSIYCTAETILTFATPVSDLTFDALGINDVGQVAQIDIFINGVYNATQNVIGNSELYDPLLQDLTAYDNITKIRIYNITDAAGIGWDTFRYDQDSTVPEPMTMLLLGLGLMGLAGLRRKMK